MSVLNEISSDVQTIIDTQWNIRKGQKVPTADSVALAGGAVELDATFLYADLADSSKMAKELDRRVAAKIIKSFLSATSKIIRTHNGVIVRFDGDRIMGVFVGDRKNSNAAKCALKTKWAVQHAIRPKFEAKYESVKKASFNIDHGIGIDTGTVIAVRGGARGDNDLIWIGRAPNLAAKLSDSRESPYQSIITRAVYNKLSDETKFGGEYNKNMWESRTFKFLGEEISVYRSSWHWGP